MYACGTMPNVQFDNEESQVELMFGERKNGLIVTDLIVGWQALWEAGMFYALKGQCKVLHKNKYTHETVETTVAGFSKVLM